MTSPFWSKGHPTGIDYLTSLVILVINIFMPGVGTIISAFLSDNRETLTILIGVAQLVTSAVIFGWIWAIIWSVLLCTAVSHPGYVPVSDNSAQPPPVPADAPATPEQHV